MARARAQASAKALCKVMRGSCAAVAAEDFLGASPEQVCVKFEDMLVDILYCHAKPCKSLLTSAAELAYDQHLSKDESCQMAERFMSAYSHCKAKAKSMTSGKKLPPSVKNICTVLLKVGDKELASSLVEKEKKLKGIRPVSLASQCRRKALEAMSPGPSCKKPKQASFEQVVQPKTLDDDLTSLRALYGLGPPKAEVGHIEVLSSQEQNSSAAGPSLVSSSSTQAEFVQYETPTEVVRLYQGGEKIVSKLSQGDNGFAVAKFGSEVVQTELPNLLLLPLMKKPAAAMKRPAAAPAAAPAGSGEEAQEAQEDEEEEEPKEEEEEVPDVLPASDKASLAATYGEKILVHKPKPYQFDNGDTMYFTDGTDQCYITVATAGDSSKKKSLVVSVSRSQAAKQHKDFRAVVIQIWNKLISVKSVSKESALQMKADLLS